MSVDDPSQRYGWTIATLESCELILEDFKMGSSKVQTILDDDAKFFREMGFRVDNPSWNSIAYTIWS